MRQQSIMSALDPTWLFALDLNSIPNEQPKLCQLWSVEEDFIQKTSDKEAEYVNAQQAQP